ncbi:MAG: T9SS type A sorting domain-containing protein [Calditrichaceae bacterium]
MRRAFLTLSMFLLLFGTAVVHAQIDPDTAQSAMIDRFSMDAGNLFVRDESNGLPGPNEPIDFDQGPFITKGLGPEGELVSYYNFDVQPTEPAPIYVLFREGEMAPVEGQLNIVNVIPGDAGYNDFWEVQKVTVPADYEANTVTSYSQIADSGYSIEETTTIVNCPIVPEGSTAELRLYGESTQLTRGWYDSLVVYYFNFSEKALMTNESDMVPLSPIYVTFNINPDMEGGGPASGFVTEEGSDQSHNVPSTLPMDAGYSPLWSVNVYDNADFDNVKNLETAVAANILATGVANVNCPIVSITASIDRFSMAAGNLFVRDESNGLPGPNEAIDFDQDPFITKGLGPEGELVSYYNFDVQPTEPAPIYVLFREGEMAPVEGQMNIIDVIPGDEGYNDFWEVQKVTVPADYEANSITSYDQIANAGYDIEETTTIVNCPVVPEGSMASLRLGDEDPGLTTGWYKGMMVYYFNFSEKALMTNESDMVPLSPIYVTFNINPDMEGGGPASGFVTEEGSDQTHNVPSTLPEDAGYSPLWSVNVYDNADFDNVKDLETAVAANILATGVANVNCPIVKIDEATGISNKEGIPVKYALGQNYPNPFNPSTEIQFAIPENRKVSLKIFNVLGQQVADLVNKELPAGNYKFTWNPQDLSSGLYFYILQAGKFKEVKKMTLLK